MQTSTRSPQEERSPEHAVGERPPQCPVCSGLLIPLRNAYRCAQCFYSICATCEGAESYPPAGD
jgi:hypothetical protein